MLWRFPRLITLAELERNKQNSLGEGCMTLLHNTLAASVQLHTYNHIKTLVVHLLNSVDWHVKVFTLIHNYPPCAI